MKSISRSPLLALVVLVACGDDSNGDPSDTVTPILARTPKIAATCSVTSPMTQRSGSDWSVADLATSPDGDAWIAYSGNANAVAPIDPDGTIGTALTLEPMPYRASGVALASDGARVAVTWADNGEGSSASLRFALIEDDAFVVAPVDVIAGAGQMQSAGLVTIGSGDFVALLGSNNGGAEGRLRVVAIDDGGATTGSVDVTSDIDSYGAYQARLTAFGDGVAVAWIKSYDASALNVRRFDAALAASGETLTLGSGRANWTLSGGLSILAIGTTLWVSWGETRFDQDALGPGAGEAEIWLAVIDGDSVKSAKLADGILDRQRTNPRLVAHRGHPALTWSEGTIIYICGGCISDYDVPFVLFDRDAAGDIVPASETVTLLHQQNGISVRGLASFDDTLLVGASLDFHALSYPAFGAITCTGP